MSVAIYLKQICKSFGALKALNNIDLEIEEGEFFALLGPNGAGKTTLINILAGLRYADSGIATVMSYDVVNDYRNARRALGVVPQELVFDPFFTVRETLVLQSGYFGLRKNDEWIDEVMHHLSLTDKADVDMRALSGGMKRRVLVAQALVHKPPIIILDEPTAGVDVELRQTLWQFIRRLNSIGHTIVLTTHYLDEAEALCNRIAMLKQGKIVALGNTQDLMSKHSERYLELRLAPAQLPDSLARHVAKKENDVYTLTFHDYPELETILAALRIAGIKIQEMEVMEPDLEDVFLQIMKKN